MRRQEHEVLYELKARQLPSRQVGARTQWEQGHPVEAAPTIGVLAWVLPEVAIIDKYGLNDAIVARQGRRTHDERRMAHDWKPPKGYVQCFRPNVRLGGRPRENERAVGRVRIRTRAEALTSEDIQECEDRNWR
jgi:arabinofuranosyltransferase